MELIKDTVKNVLANLESKKTNCIPDDPGILLKKFFSKKELSHIKFNSLRKGRLSINVDSSVWLYHLNLQKEALLAKLAKEAPLVKEVRFRLGGLK